jgi:hypothetical protein
MKALLALVSANLKKSAYVMAILPMIVWIYPAIAHGASAADGQALVFELNSNKQDLSNTQTQTSVTYDQIVNQDPLVTNLRQYLAQKQPGSPLITLADKIVTYDDWKRVLAISFVESNMCMHTPKVWAHGTRVESFNCSGMDGGKRVYASYEQWFADMDALLHQPNYAQRPLQKFIGYYVVPGSYSWLHGASSVESELEHLELAANDERVALANQNFNISVAKVELAVK